MKIVQVNTADIGGGAERVAMNLHQAYRAAGHNAVLAVGRKRSNTPGVVAIPHEATRSRWTRACLAVERTLLGQSHRIGSTPRLRAAIRHLADPARFIREQLGRERFDYPASATLLDESPDVLHLHNLHGGYFDLRQLPRLSHAVTTILTLHDMWTLTGHCSHSIECEKWQRGCGGCPHLDIYPATKRDATRRNWITKSDIYTQSRLYIASPSRWLADRVEQSILSTAMVESRVIPNGVDLSIYRPADQRDARATLGLPQDVHILVFAANGIRHSPFKDFRTLHEAVHRISRLVSDRPVLCLAVGEIAPPRRLGSALLRFVPPQSNQRIMADYYRAADVYVHASKADTHPLAVLEALACGVPVVASAVGGIVEQIDDGLTGFLPPGGDPEAMAVRCASLLRNPVRRRHFAVCAAATARLRFDLRAQVAAYLDWQHSLVQTTATTLRKAA